MPQTSFRRACSIAAVIVLLTCTAMPAGQPLHERIDQTLAAAKPGYEKQAAATAEDAELLQRIYLTLAVTIPTATEARAFLKDTTADKRAQLIDRLLASPEYARHMQNVFDVMLMERRPDKN